MESDTCRAPRTDGRLVVRRLAARHRRDDAERVRGEAAFARLCGVAPIPASSGTTRRHRLHRGGDRAANRALHIAVVVRLRHDPRTRAYAERRTRDGLSKLEIIRCLKR